MERQVLLVEKKMSFARVLPGKTFARDVYTSLIFGYQFVSFLYDQNVLNLFTIERNSF